MRKILSKLLPRLVKIEVVRKDCEDFQTSVGDSLSFYFWIGYKHYKWLWFEWERKIYEGKHFYIDGNKLSFKRQIKKDVSITATYITDTYQYRKGQVDKDCNTFVI